MFNICDFDLWTDDNQKALRDALDECYEVILHAGTRIGMSKSRRMQITRDRGELAKRCHYFGGISTAFTILTPDTWGKHDLRLSVDIRAEKNDVGEISRVPKVDLGWPSFSADAQTAGIFGNAVVQVAEVAATCEVILREAIALIASNPICPKKKAEQDERYRLYNLPEAHISDAKARVYFRDTIVPMFLAEDVSADLAMRFEPKHRRLLKHLDAVLDVTHRRGKESHICLIGPGLEYAAHVAKTGAQKEAA